MSCNTRSCVGMREQLELVPAIFVLVSLAMGLLGFWMIKPDRESICIFLISTSTASLILLFSGVVFTQTVPIYVSFGIEIGSCVSDLFVGSIPTPDVFMHHVSTIIAISFSLFRDNISLEMLGVLNGSVCVSNLVASCSRLLYLRSCELRFKQRGLLLTTAVAVVCRVMIPGWIVFEILLDLYRDGDRPEWARLFATSLLMLMFLNLQLVWSYTLKLRSHKRSFSL